MDKDEVIQDCETYEYMHKGVYEDPCKRCYPWDSKYQPIEKEGRTE